MSNNKQNKKTFNLEDLKIDSLVTTLTDDEQSELLGGHGDDPSTNCGNPDHGCPPKQVASLQSV